MLQETPCHRVEPVSASVPADAESQRHRRMKMRWTPQPQPEHAPVADAAAAPVQETTALSEGDAAAPATTQEEEPTQAPAAEERCKPAGARSSPTVQPWTCREYTRSAFVSTALKPAVDWFFVFNTFISNGSLHCRPVPRRNVKNGPNTLNSFTRSATVVSEQSSSTLGRIAFSNVNNATNRFIYNIGQEAPMKASQLHFAMYQCVETCVISNVGAVG